jgi:hypothetical protein
MPEDPRFQGDKVKLEKFYSTFTEELSDPSSSDLISRDDCKSDQLVTESAILFINPVKTAIRDRTNDHSTMYTTEKTIEFIRADAVGVVSLKEGHQHKDNMLVNTTMAKYSGPTLLVPLFSSFGEFQLQIANGCGVQWVVACDHNSYGYTISDTEYTIQMYVSAIISILHKISNETKLENLERWIVVMMHLVRSTKAYIAYVSEATEIIADLYSVIRWEKVLYSASSIFLAGEMWTKTELLCIVEAAIKQWYERQIPLGYRYKELPCADIVKTPITDIVTILIVIPTLFAAIQKEITIKEAADTITTKITELAKINAGNVHLDVKTVNHLGIHALFGMSKLSWLLKADSEKFFDFCIMNAKEIQTSGFSITEHTIEDVATLSLETDTEVKVHRSCPEESKEESKKFVKS